MPKARSAKAPGTYEWINASIELPPIGIRPSRAGNNDTGAKGKLKCAGCRLSKIKCIYDDANLESVCLNCNRRGITCGVKLPGPKAQIDAQHDRGPDEVKEYVRLFERFQRLRPEDSAEEIEKLITLVENGTLKEEGGNFVVRTSDEDFEMESLDCDWEPSSHNTARIQIDEFGDGYFSAPALTHHKAAGDDVPRLGLGASKNCANLFAGAPLPWVHDAMHIHPGFVDFDHAFSLSSTFPEEPGMRYF